MDIIKIIQESVVKAVKSLYNEDIIAQSVTCSATRKEFEGDFTVVVFPYTIIAKKKPNEIGNELGIAILEAVDEIEKFNVIQGFLNFTLNDAFWIEFLKSKSQSNSVLDILPTGDTLMIEFASPNTNKPLHLGHIRNILLGWSYSQIAAAVGNKVIKTQVINDRGIAICKSMLAWQIYGNESTPESESIKGDKFVGDYYVLFETKFKEEYSNWQDTSESVSIYDAKKKPNQSKEDFFKEYKNEYFNHNSKLGAQAREMLLKWEANDLSTKLLWEKMNNWVYTGFDDTFNKLGIKFDKNYYESNTYLLGIDTIEEGLKNGIFYQKEDNSIWIDLEKEKLDHKLVVRSDGTSVYITQDIGMAKLRSQEFHPQKVVYVVADEQNYHFKVLFEILKKLGEPYAEDLHHLAYGMVELPTGKMKSREGTVVDADDLIAITIQEAVEGSKERGEITDFTEEERNEINRKIGIAALKYHIIKVNPLKKMIFDPKESVDLQGQTGPYIQYSFVRINGVTKRAITDGIDITTGLKISKLEPQEKELIIKMYRYKAVVQDAAATLDPSVIANYAYDLAKLYHKFWHDLSIFNTNDKTITAFRLLLSKEVGRHLKHSFELLGIEMPERM
jgi:arginyl-tRNA synthetase